MNPVKGKRIRWIAWAVSVAMLVGICQRPALAQNAAPTDNDAAVEESTTPTGGFLVDEQPDDTLPQVGQDLADAAVKTVVALLIVLALILLLAYLLRRASAQMRQIGGGGIAVLAQVPLGPSQFMSVVDIGGEIIVLGVTDHQITVISEIEDPNLIETLREDRSLKGRPSQMLNGLPTFKQWLQRAQRGDDE